MPSITLTCGTRHEEMGDGHDSVRTSLSLLGQNGRCKLLGVGHVRVAPHHQAHQLHGEDVTQVVEHLLPYLLVATDRRRLGGLGAQRGRQRDVVRVRRGWLVGPRDEVKSGQSGRL